MGKLKHLYMDHRGRMPDDDGWRWNMTDSDSGWGEHLAPEAVRIARATMKGIYGEEEDGV